MNNLENSIKDCITKELEKGVIEKVIAAKLEECIASSIKDMFGWNGAVKNVIEDKVKSVMIPYLEKYDYSEYITKLDCVLVEVLKSSTLENKTLLKNFKELISTNEIPKTVKLSDIYDKWQEYCSKEVDTDKLEEDCGEYEYLDVTLNVEELSSDWSIYERYIIRFECEKDDSLNIELGLKRWKESSSPNYEIDYDRIHSLNSLRHLNLLEIYMMRLEQNSTMIELDTHNESDEVEVEANPYD